MTSDGVGRKKGRMPAALNGTIASSSGLHCYNTHTKKKKKKEPSIANVTLKGTLKEDEKKKKEEEGPRPIWQLAHSATSISRPACPGRVHSLPVVNQQQIVDGKEMPSSSSQLVEIAFNSIKLSKLKLK